MTDPSSPNASLPPAVFASIAGLFIFLWASGFIAAKFGLPYAEPFTLLASRFILGAAILVPVSFVLRASWPDSPGQVFHILVAGFGVQTVYLIGVFYGIWFGLSTGITALVVGLQPILTGVLAGLILAERVSRANWIGLIMGFAGLALVVADRVTAPEEHYWGLALVLLALLGITLGTLYQKRFCGNFDVRTGVALQNVMSAAVTLGLAVCFESMVIQWTVEFVGAVLWSAIGLSVIGIALYYWMVQRGAAARVTSVIYLSPPATAIMGWLAFGETLSWYALVGMVVAMGGVALAVRTR